MKLSDAEDALLAWARTQKFQKKVDYAKGIIKQTLEISQKPYVAFSCGKDSSVLADMVLSIDKTVPLRFLSSGETRIIHDVDTVIDYFKNQGATIEEINIDRVFSDDWKDATWTEQRKAGNKDLQSLTGDSHDCIFMGLRKEESKPREISLTRCRTEGYPAYTYKYMQGANAGVIRCCPLATWTTSDIAAYIVANGLPTLDWYKTLGIEGRTTARLTGDAVRQNVMVYIKNKNPDGYNKLIKRFPELKLYE